MWDIGKNIGTRPKAWAQSLNEVHRQDLLSKATFTFAPPTSAALHDTPTPGDVLIVLICAIQLSVDLVLYTFPVFASSRCSLPGRNSILPLAASYVSSHDDREYASRKEKKNVDLL
jgi:hypothetical protein